MRPLHDALTAYLEKDPARFHMPGHKGAGAGPFAQLLPWDITEVEGADSLFHADGPLLELERAFARLYGAERTLLSAGGATLCIQTMLALACKPGDTVIMSRGIHRAAINACALLDLRPAWLYPDESAGPWYLGRYTAEGVRAALAAHPQAAAVYLTCPDYFGVMSSLHEISAACRAAKRPLLVDNAHGAHLKFLPAHWGAPHPIDCGAALCCDSLHKTMPAMTGAALLHIGERGFLPHAKRLMSVFGSTSPSYPIMLSAEDALSFAERIQADAPEENPFEEVLSRLEGLRALADAHGFAQPQGRCEPMRLSLGFGALGWDAQAFGGYLRARGIEPEYLSGSSCVLMASPYNRESDFDRLAQAIIALPPRGFAQPRTHALPRPVQVCSVREAAFSTQETVPVENARGRIAAGESSPCPPGIPIVMGGERIGLDEQEALLAYGVREVCVMR